MKIDQGIVGLLIWAVLLACGFVALLIFGILPIFKDIISGKNIEILLMLLSLSGAGYFVGKYFKRRCEKKVKLSGRRVNCSSEGMAAFMSFMFFSAILLAFSVEHFK